MTTGTLAFDAGTHEDARQALDFALGCAAEEAKDWHLRATVLSPIDDGSLALAAPTLTWTGAVVTRACAMRCARHRVR